MILRGDGATGSLNTSQGMSVSIWVLTSFKCMTIKSQCYPIHLKVHQSFGDLKVIQSWVFVFYLTIENKVN